MCGIAGILASYAPLVTAEKLHAMAQAIAHRGPDGEKIWINDDGLTGFAHRRLAIIDLSAKAAQPFHYLHYTIVYNGEIYNYLPLRGQLQQAGYSFSTGSDTEVLAAAFDCWGLQCMHRLDGMFAFAILNRKTNEVFLVRDRFGEKPLYYFAVYKQRGRFEQFLFASEMKALWAAGAKQQVNGTMLLNYLTLGMVQNAQKKTDTFFNDILSLPPGHYLTIQPSAGKLQMKRWYLPERMIAQKKETVSLPEAVNTFRQLFISSVKQRLHSDVPVGVSVSGGIDSSSVVAALNKCQRANKMPSFSAVFPGFEKDETSFIKEVSSHFNLQSVLLTPTVEDIENYWQTFMHIQEEPVQSSSAFTQFMVYKKAAEHKVTVLLDGQGADEIMAGYTRYVPWYLQFLLRHDVRAFWKEKKLLQQNNFLESWGLSNYAAAMFPAMVSTQLQKRALRLQENTRLIHKNFLRKFQNPSSLIKPGVKEVNDLLYYNTFHLGLPELLRYADRNSMAHSREVRLPFLNNELVEFLFCLPASFKINNGYTKWILRESMQQLLPPSITWRKGKTGYEPPQQQWLQSPAIKAMISSARQKLVEADVLSPSVLKTPVIAAPAHAAGNYDWRYLSAAALL